MKKIVFLLIWVSFIFPIGAELASPGELWAQNPFLRQGDDGRAANKPQEQHATPDKPSPNQTSKPPADKGGLEDKAPAEQLGAQEPGFVVSFWSDFLHQVNSWQAELNERIAELIQRIKEGSKRALVIIFLVAFVYGVIHALGPGHGKSIVTSYFLSTQAPLTQGVLVGVLIAGVHTLSAVVVTGSIFFVLKGAVLAGFDNTTQYVQLVSYALILVIGLFLLLHTLKHLRSNSRDPKGQDSHQANATKADLVSGNKGIWGVALAIGVVPCPGASLLLLFALNMGVYTAGFVATGFMSLGMAITISFFAVVAILLKQLLQRMEGKGRWLDAVFHGTELVAALFVIFLGGVLLAGRLL